jgi:phage shock protein C
LNSASTDALGHPHNYPFPTHSSEQSAACAADTEDGKRMFRRERPDHGFRRSERRKECVMAQQILPEPRLDSGDQTGNRQTDDQPVRSLRRSKENRVIAGVCGGLGYYLGIDPVLLRLGLVALTFGAGSGVLLYIVLWIVIPEAQAGEDLGPAPETASRDTVQLIIGGGLVFIGALILAGQVVPWWDNRLIWPAVLILIGLFVLMKGARK